MKLLLPIAVIILTPSWLIPSATVVAAAAAAAEKLALGLRGQEHHARSL